MSNSLDLPVSTKKQTFLRDDFTCQKCCFRDVTTEKLDVHHKNPKVSEGSNVLDNLITLCNICHHFAPNSAKDTEIYLAEKIDGKILETFRKSSYSPSRRTKQGMINRFSQGAPTTKPPFGYKMVDKKLEVNQETSQKVKLLFEEFLASFDSLNKLARRYNLTVNGLKKILTNRTYLGNVKFGGKVSKGTHQPLIDESTFNKVQEKICSTQKIGGFSDNMADYYSQLIEDIFIKGDIRYLDDKESAVYFLKNNAVTVEAKEVSHLINDVPLPKEVLEINGPQQPLKRLALSIFQEFGVELIGFERNVGYGRVDILGRLSDKKIFVECGPCRIDKCFNYLREDNIELWLVDAWLESSAKEQAMLYIIRHGPNWQRAIEKYDAHKLLEIKKVKSPLDSL